MKNITKFLGNAFLAPKIKFLLKFLVIVVREIWLLVPNLVRRKWLLVPNLVRQIWLLVPNLVRQIWLLVPNLVREMWLLVPNLVREKVTLHKMMNNLYSHITNRYTHKGLINMRNYSWLSFPDCFLLLMLRVSPGWQSSSLLFFFCFLLTRPNWDMG